MSYDLWFWKQNNACKSSPEDVMKALINDTEVTGVETLDIDGILQDIRTTFPAYEDIHHTQTGELIQIVINSEDSSWVISLDWSEKFFCVESHSAPGSVLNQFIDIALEYGCYLYDPQDNVRYTG